MYNKLFSKILDSSIWLEDAHIRLVWITFLAVMDQDGMVALSGIGNVALRARVSEEQAADAIKCLEEPDDKNPDQDNEGRRIERIAGVGWFVLNAAKYRDIIKAEDARAANRERVRRHRSKGNADVTTGNESVMPSDTNTNTEDKKTKEKKRSPKAATLSAHQNLIDYHAKRIGEMFDAAAQGKAVKNLLKTIPESDLIAYYEYQVQQLTSKGGWRDAVSWLTVQKSIGEWIAAGKPPKPIEKLKVVPKGPDMSVGKHDPDRQLAEIPPCEFCGEDICFKDHRAEIAA